MNATGHLAEMISGSGVCVPEQVRERAKRYILDTLAVTVAGHNEPSLHSLRSAMTPDASGVMLPWGGERYREEDACLLIGMASHVLDYDDVCMLAVCHPSAPVVSSLLALSEQAGLSGEQFLHAYVIGTEVMIRCGEAMGFRHYDLGFHATATLGVLGATGACARALKLTSAQTRHALAIAASQSGGLRKNFGTMIKPLHVGFAASNGLRAARLALAGVMGVEDILQNDGWLRAFSGDCVNVWPDAVKPGEPYAIAQTGFEQKRYPCCYMMHKIIRGTLDLRREHGLGLEGFVQASIEMPMGGLAPLVHPHPVTGLSAKFSGNYAVVAALADGAVNLASFHDKAVLRDAIQAALPSVKLNERGGVAVSGGDVGAAPVIVSLQYQNGKRYTCTVRCSPGSEEDPLADAELRDKWNECFAIGQPELPAAVVQARFDAGLALEREPAVAQWLGL